MNDEPLVATIPISEFEHRVARWAEHLRKTGEPLQVSQRGRTSLVVLDSQTFERWRLDRERLQALEIKLLVQEGEKAFRRGRWLPHQAVGKRLKGSGRRVRRRT